MEANFLADPRVWVGIAFTIFLLVFWGKIWNLVVGGLDRRAAGIKAALDEAVRLRTEAEAMLRDAQSRREAAMHEAASLLEFARTEAARLADAARTDAQAAGRRRERMAMDRISAAEKAAVTEVQQVAASVASQAAAEGIAHGLSPETDAMLVNRAIAGLPAALAGRRAA